MYVQSSILAAGSDLIGWRQSTNSLYDLISSNLKSPDTEYYVNDIPGITVDLINYVGHESNTSDYLQSIHNSELLKLIDDVVHRQKDKLNTKELLSHNTLIQDYNELDMSITRDSRFVGYAIRPKESNNIISKILSVGFMSPAAQSFTLYLFDTSHKAAIQSKSISISTEDSIEWTTLDWDVSFDREDGSAGQVYLLGYFEDDLSYNLYEQDWTGRCATSARRIFGHYMGVSPFRFRNSALNGTNIPTIEYLEGALNCKTSGFNIRFNTKCDITKILVDNISMFAKPLQYAVAIRILNDCLSTYTLNNITQAQQHRERWDDLLTEYNGKLYGGITTAGTPMPGMIDQLVLDFSNIDAVCLKDRKNKVRFVKW